MSRLERAAVPTGMHRSLAVTLALALSAATLASLASCTLSHPATTEDDSGVASDVRVFTPFDGGCIMPIGPTRWVPDETGACLGLAAPGCVSCHARAGGIDIRPAPGPSSAPPPPPGSIATMPGACGLCRP